MKILIFGAGVMGSLYAARLWKAGHDVNISWRVGDDYLRSDRDAFW